MILLYRYIRRFLLFSIQFVNLIFFAVLFTIIKPKRTIKNAVFIFRTDAIGDFILSLDAIKTLSKHFSRQYKVLLVNKSISKWFQALNLVDQVIPFDREKFILNPIYHFHILKKIKSIEYTNAYYLNYSRELLGDEIILQSNANEKIGWNGDSSRISKFLMSFSNSFYTRLITPEKVLQIEKERNDDFVIKSLNIKKIYSINYYDIIINENYYEELLKKYNIIKNNYIVIAAGSRISKKIWDLKNFVEIINWLYKDFGLINVLIGAPNESYIGKYIFNSTTKGSSIDLIGKLNFNEIIYLLKNSKILLTNDNAISHICIMIDCRMVGILGGGQFGRFAPYGSERQHWVYKKMDCFNCDWICKYKNFKCIQDITIEEIKNIINLIINCLNNI